MQNSGLHRPVTRPHIVCNTCAADGRELQAIRSLPHCLDICKGLSLSKNDMVCFECHAMMRKFIRFRLRAKRVKHALLKCAKFNLCKAENNSKIECLSTLGQTVISPNDTIYIDGDSVEVKQEISVFRSDLTEFMNKIPEKPWPDGNLEHVADNIPLSQVYLLEGHSITDVKETKDVPEPLVHVKEEMGDIEIEVEPYLVARPHSNLEKKADNMPMFQEHLKDMNKGDFFTEVKGTKDVPEVPEIVIEEMHPKTFESYLKQMLAPKDGNQEGFRITKKMAQSAPMVDDNYNDDDDPETDNAEPSQQFYTLQRIDHTEVLAQMERDRSSEAFKFARYKCDQCALILRTGQLYQAHVRLHSETRGPAVCTFCQQRFPTQEEAQTHIATHYCRYQCCHCDRVEGTFQSIEGHFRREHDTTPRYCRQCFQRFTQYRALRKHKRAAHSVAFSCDSCDKRFSSQNVLKHHKLMKHTKVSLLECDVCHKKYKGDFNLQKHLRSAHVRVPNPNDENAYCAQCDKQFPSILNYKLHLKNNMKHSEGIEHRFECDYCGKRCKEKASLRTHIELKHLKIARYKCDVCEKSFPTVAYMTRHKREKHAPAARPKRHVCHLCKKAFTIRKSLNEHMNTHFGRRPFKCKLCEATFAYSAALYTHNQLVHLKRKVGKSRNA